MLFTSMFLLVVTGAMQGVMTADKGKDKGKDGPLCKTEFSIKGEIKDMMVKRSGVIKMVEKHWKADNGSMVATVEIKCGAGTITLLDLKHVQNKKSSNDDAKTNKDDFPIFSDSSFINEDDTYLSDEDDTYLTNEDDTYLSDEDDTNLTNEDDTYLSDEDDTNFTNEDDTYLSDEDDTNLTNEGDADDTSLTDEDEILADAGKGMCDVKADGKSWKVKKDVAEKLAKEQQTMLKKPGTVVMKCDKDEYWYIQVSALRAKIPEFFKGAK